MSVRSLVVAALIVLSIVALVFLLGHIFSILLVILLAVVFAEGIRPLVRALEARRIPMPLGIVIVYVAILGAMAGLALLLVQPIVNEAQSLVSNFPTYQRQLLDLFNHLEQQFHFSANIQSYVSGALGTAQQVLVTVGTTILALIVNFILILVVGFMWLVTSDRLKRFVVDLFPPRRQALATEVIGEIGFRTGGFVRAVLINGLAVGIATAVASFFLGLPSPILLGVFSGLIAIIPVVGAVVGVVPPTLIAFTISPFYPIVVLAVMLVIQLADANTVVPLVMNRVVALPALVVVLALLIGGALAGVVGALLAVPVAAALQVLVVRVLVPVIHAAQGRPDPGWDASPPAALQVQEAAARRSPGLRWVARLRRP